MILAFMILWDLPNIRRGVASLETSRLSAVYKEVAPTFGVFGTLFGKALQAQACPGLPNKPLKKSTINYKFLIQVVKISHD